MAICRVRIDAERMRGIVQGDPEVAIQRAFVAFVEGAEILQESFADEKATGVNRKWAIGDANGAFHDVRAITRKLEAASPWIFLKGIFKEGEI